MRPAWAANAILQDLDPGSGVLSIVHWLQALNEEPGVCPEATSNVFSLLTFGWVGPLMRLGYKCAALVHLYMLVVDVSHLELSVCQQRSYLHVRRDSWHPITGLANFLCRTYGTLNPKP